MVNPGGFLCFATVGAGEGCRCWRVSACDACRIDQVCGLAHVVQQLAREVAVRVPLLSLKAYVLPLACAIGCIVLPGCHMLHRAARWHLLLWNSEALCYFRACRHAHAAAAAAGC